jgi:RNA polymerase sigma-54 factor
MVARPRIQISQTLRLELNTNLQASIGILRTDAAGLSRYLEEQAAENPHLRLVQPAPAPGDWLPRWSGVLAPSGGGGADADYAPSAGPSLAAHVIAEIEGLRLPPRARRIAEALADALEPSGWLGRPLTVIADEAAATLAEVEATLKRLQQMEPRGLFARDLAECLALQAEEIDALDAAMQVVLTNLPLLASGQTARLARLAGTDEAGVLARFRLIRGMNPKPGVSFAGPGSAPPPREPDLLARPRPEGGWEISLNRSALPTVEVQRADKGDAAQLAAARALKQAVEARGTTLLRVGREIAALQEGALNDGAAALVPMTMAELGEALGLHESTISRVVAGTSLDTPRGTWWLRRMFSTARKGAEGIAVSGAALRHRLAQLVAAEDPAKPLSDAALADAISKEAGVALPRRTAAQYRTDAGIPPAHRRRRR